MRRFVRRYAEVTVMRMVEPERTKVGFIGLGVMGRSMASHIRAAGYELHVWSRRPGSALPLAEKGAVCESSPAALASATDVVITMVGFPKDVEDVYLGADGILAGVRPGMVLADMTTSSPALAVRIAEETEKRGAFSLDAPVSGGDRGAREATLSIMVGGSEEAFAAMTPLFGVMGKNVLRQGGPGCGQHTKMANQIAIASGMIGVCEALAYAKKSGLDQQRVLDSISGGAAGSWSLSNLAPRMLAGNFAPGFYVKHFIKDMRIAVDEARAMDQDVPGLELALSLYERLAEAGYAEEGTQALYRLFTEEAE
jgi:3-hydroxyisobutyrate dehydrogenase